ncbi:hypothetical protein BMU06_23225 [Escherichia coli]|nr:hypothetical protein BMU06_23225 [Escherichia coli]
MFFRFFPSFGGFFFHFLLRPILLFALANCVMALLGNDSNLLIVFYVQIMPDDFVMQLHRF